jgi:drug/metabolite transporter (DMT)-like permease
MMTALQMLVGGVFVGVLAAVRGEFSAFELSAVSMRSFLAWAYLVVFGSLIAFTAYVYILRVSTPARVATYAYVNPVVAVILGWLLAGEAISARMLVSAGIIIAGVALITYAEGRASAPAAPARAASAGKDAAPGRISDPVVESGDDVPAKQRA